MLTRLVLALLLAAAAAAAPQDLCLAQRLDLWNRFATDANAYTHRLTVNAEKDARTRDKLDKEWLALHRCTCW